MELMSSLLLCALAALLPRASDSTPVIESNVKINDTKIIDVKCKNCINCMERAIKAQQIQEHMMDGTPDTEELANDVLQSQKLEVFREKRNAENKVELATSATSTPKSVSKSGKSKKPSKTVSVSKYSTDGQVYALKVKEGESTGQESGATCRLYTVKKYFPCESPEGDLMLTNAKRKASKKNKKEQAKKKPIITTQKPLVLTEQISRAAIKREVSNSRNVEQYMTSIEDLY